MPQPRLRLPRSRVTIHSRVIFPSSRSPLLTVRIAHLRLILQRYQVYALAVALCAGLSYPLPVLAEEPPSTLIGKQTVGLIAGGMLPVRVLEARRPN